jgi:molecular chaperone Hsp33
MADRLLTASAAHGTISLVAGITTSLVRETQIRHHLAPTASAAVGRLITGTALLGASLKGRERLTLQIAGDGPLGQIAADAHLEPNGAVGARAYTRNPHVDIPLNSLGKFDVAGAIGAGQLQVTKSYEVGQPYQGIVPLDTGEIGDDIASYLLNSQQVPSVVALGVLANPAGIVAAGGIIAQLMPGADEHTIATLEANVKSMATVTTQIAEGASCEDLLVAITGTLGLNVFHEFEVAFKCRCTREKVESALLGLGRDELVKIASEQPQTEATCEFCKHIYVLSADEVGQLVARFD